MAEGYEDYSRKPDHEPSKKSGFQQKLDGEWDPPKNKTKIDSNKFYPTFQVGGFPLVPFGNQFRIGTKKPGTTYAAPGEVMVERKSLV